MTIGKQQPNLPSIEKFAMSGKRGREEEKEGKTKKMAGAGHWSRGLLVSMSDPQLLVNEDEKVVAIKDKYPKAKHHYLVLPKENISSLAKATKEHLPLLRHMHRVAEELADKNPESHFRLGYHAHASMERLHLHVISDDFISPCLKTKKHWNTFTTGFFVPSEDIIKQIEEKGKVIPISTEKIKAYMNMDLKCHKCDMDIKNIPTLKKHLESKHGH